MILWTVSSSLATLLVVAVILLLTQRRQLTAQQQREQDQEMYWKLQMEKQEQKSLALTTKLMSLQRESMSEATEGLLDLVRTGQNLVAAADVISYQQISLMSNPSVYDRGTDFDPSDEGENARIRERSQRLGDEAEQEAPSGYSEIEQFLGFGGDFGIPNPDS